MPHFLQKANCVSSFWESIYHGMVVCSHLQGKLIRSDSLSPRFNFSPQAHMCAFFVSTNIEEYTAHVTLNNSQSVGREFIQSLFGQSKLYYMQFNLLYLGEIYLESLIASKHYLPNLFIKFKIKVNINL